MMTMMGMRAIEKISLHGTAFRMGRSRDRLKCDLSRIELERVVLFLRYHVRAVKNPKVVSMYKGIALDVSVRLILLDCLNVARILR